MSEQKQHLVEQVLNLNNRIKEISEDKSTRKTNIAQRTANLEGRTRELVAGR